MKRIDFDVMISVLLLLSLCVTGLLGYVQSELELHRFVPHRYAAYATLILAAIHVATNASKLWHYVLKRIKPKPE
jgi:hypothetical protein